MRFKFTGLLVLVVALFAPFAMMAQEMNVSGTVTSSEDGLPMPGVSIIVVGTTNGTSTDFDGNFSIDANTGDQLQFSFIGFSDKTVTISGATVNVVFQERRNHLVMQCKQWVVMSLIKLNLRTLLTLSLVRLQVFRLKHLLTWEVLRIS